MICRLADLRCKDVIDLRDGSCLGYVCDVELDCEKARVCAIVVRQRMRFFFFARGEETVIPFEKIKVIGDDAILVCFEPKNRPKPEKSTGFYSGKELY